VRITWTGVDSIVRHGEVWCPGPFTDNVWVIPDEPRDGEGRAVCVGLDGRQTAEQGRWSQAQRQTLVGLGLASPSWLASDVDRGGQLRARIAPRAPSLPAYPDVEIQSVYARSIVDVELPDLSREDTR